MDQAVNPLSPSGPGDAKVGFAQTLSSRQREVLQLVAEGKATKEISINVGEDCRISQDENYEGMRLRTAAELNKVCDRSRTDFDSLRVMYQRLVIPCAKANLMRSEVV